jgi:excisionase family DNA binding protein
MGNAQIIRISKDREWWKESREPSERARIVKTKRKLPSRLMTVQEVAGRLGCKIWLVYDLIRGREIDWQPVGKRGKRISEDALMDYLERRKLEERARRGA